MKRLFFFKLIFLLGMLCLLACGGQKQISDNSIPITKNPKLLFINYTLEAQEENTKKIQLINKKITDGLVKTQSHKFISQPNVDDIKCVQLDKNYKTIHVDYIRNPLIKFTETTNESLEFSRQKHILKKAPISLKLQLHPEAHYLRLLVITDNKKSTTELITTKLD
ncbi:hypothetical protein PW52_01045 [Tamlana sedimentorum]|uniref:Lipoprotein n=1 Tax=Neotamlana sedimentorum TaxID=1435349 RepID=A0A0D7WD90_9FLAO|nr:hypothetical protein [Tamlana sedimentorum]KJD37076.1 hypothetical protein PW52_01045 [Tamlana sedimentorum]